MRRLAQNALKVFAQPVNNDLGIDANHDYNDLTDVEFNKVYKAVLGFMAPLDDDDHG